MSNVIDDVILSAQKTPDGVVIQMTIDTFRQLISALNYSSGAWVATDNPTDSPADSDSQTDHEPNEQPAESDSQTDQQSDVPVDESANTSRRRSPNQKVTIKDARALFDMARKHPDFTKVQLSKAVGLLPFTIYNKNHQFDIFGDGVPRTLYELLRLGRIVGNDSINRFGNETYNENDVAEMGISSKYRREE